MYLGREFILFLIVLLISAQGYGQFVNKQKNHDSFGSNGIIAKNDTGFNIDLAANTSVIYGPEAVFNFDHTLWLNMVMSDANHFIIAYCDGGDGLSGKAIIGTIYGKTISYSDPYLFNPGITSLPSISCLDSTHFVITYRDNIGSGTNNETLIAGTINGNEISFGSPVVFSVSSYSWCNSVVAGLDTSRFVLAYNDYNDSLRGKAVIGTLSGLNISLDSAYVFTNSTHTADWPALTSWSITCLDSNRFAIAYSMDVDSCRGIVTIGNATGNMIEFGSEYVFNTDVAQWPSITSLGSDRFVIAYSDMDSNYFLDGRSIIGNVIGNNISFSQEYEFFGQTSYISASALDSIHFVVLYFNNENVHSGASRIGTVVENTIYYDEEITYNPAYSFYQTVDCYNENRYVITYDDQLFSHPPNWGTSIIGEISRYPVITKINTDTVCPGNLILPIFVQYMEDVVEFSLTLYYDTSLHTYQGYQNPCSLLDTGTLNIVNIPGQIDLSWNSITSVNISYDTLIVLLFENTSSYNQSISNLIWDTNSYYKDSQAYLLESTYHDGYIVIHPIPDDADTIYGNSIVCQGSIDESYQVGHILNATSYLWGLVPDSAGIIIGTDTMITIEFSTTYTGQVTLSVFGSNFCGDGDSSSLVIDIVESPIANAGYDDEICEYESYLLSGEAFNYSSLNWTTSGDGYFDNPTILTATYYPGSSDISNGGVDLILTANPIYPCADSITDQLGLDIVSLPAQPSTPVGPTVINLGTTQFSEYTTSQVYGSTSFEWFLNPLDAGSIEGNDTIGTVFWNSSFTGLFAFVNVVAINECDETISDSLYINLNPIGIYNNSGFNIVIYPNPSSGNVYLSFDQYTDEIHVTVVSSEGVIVLQRNLINNKTSNIHQLDLANNSNGIYYIRIVINDKMEYYKLVLINTSY